MPTLNTMNIHLLCDANKNLVRENVSEDCIDKNGSVDLSILNLQARKELVNQLIENEKSNVEASEENYQKGKYKAKHINMLLISAVALLGAGFTLAPFFIVSSIILPVIPILLFGVAIITITKFFLNIKINHLETNAKHAINSLNQLKECKEPDIDGKEVINAINNGIQKIEKITLNTNAKINELAAKDTINRSKFFSTDELPLRHSNSANETHREDEDTASSPKHN